jgi:DnaJ-class molecular chaperone
VARREKFGLRCETFHDGVMCGTSCVVSLNAAKSQSVATGTQHGEELVLRGSGLVACSAANATARGDLHIRVSVSIPRLVPRPDSLGAQVPDTVAATLAEGTPPAEADSGGLLRRQAAVLEQLRTLSDQRVSATEACVQAAG